MQPNSDIKPGNAFFRHSSCLAFLHGSVELFTNANNSVYYHGGIVYLKPYHVAIFLNWVRKDDSDVHFALCYYDDTLIELADVYMTNRDFVKINAMRDNIHVKPT